jgi:hypothetical protein
MLLSRHVRVLFKQNTLANSWRPDFQAGISHFGSVDFRYIFAYSADVSWEQSKADGKLIFLGACLIAAVRLAREEKWDNSPRVIARIGDSVQLAQRVYERVKREFPHFFSPG